MKETEISNGDNNATEEKHRKSDQRTNTLRLTWNQRLLLPIPQRGLGEKLKSINGVMSSFHWYSQ